MSASNGASATQNDKTLIPASINGDHNDTDITFTSDKWVGELMYDPGYKFSCSCCGTEIEDAVGGYCAHCACELFDQPEPITTYQKWRQKEEDIESTPLTYEYTGPEVLRLQNITQFCKICEKENTQTNDVICPSCWETCEELPIPWGLAITRSDSDNPINKDIQLSCDQLPGSVEELYEYLDEHLKNQDVPIVIEEKKMASNQKFISRIKFSNFKSIEDIKEKIKAFMLMTTYNDNFEDWSQRVDENGLEIHRIKVFKFILEVNEDADTETLYNPNKNPVFKVSIFTEIVTIRCGGTLWNQFEACLECLSEYLDNVSTEEDNCATNKDLDKKHPTCFMCAENNYPSVMIDAGRIRMICRDCMPEVTRCAECDTLTLEKTYYNPNIYSHSCFDCKFNTQLKEQMPIEAHLLRIIDIQHLARNHFDILADYTELAQLTIFEAYRYKSTCHFYNCDIIIPPNKWDAEETFQFCGKRHKEYAEDIGCHCQYVCNNTNYDDDYQADICKLCNSQHQANVATRVALRETSKGVKPILSTICVFDEELKMSNVLNESLIDLVEYFM